MDAEQFLQVSRLRTISVGGADVTRKGIVRNPCPIMTHLTKKDVQKDCKISENFPERRDVYYMCKCENFPEKVSKLIPKFRPNFINVFPCWVRQDLTWMLIISFKRPVCAQFEKVSGTDVTRKGIVRQPCPFITHPTKKDVQNDSNTLENFSASNITKKIWKCI